jgi:hypothetical protein
MIPNDADTRDSHRAADVGGEFLRFFGESVLVRSPQSSSTSALPEISANASCIFPRECLA